ncbi:MAG: hypothetical protein WBX00_35960 [Isosphaeraceae bacterium]
MKNYCYPALALGLLVLMGTPAQSQVPGQPYQIPSGYEGAPVGASVSYGGAYYVIQGNGTMIPAGGYADGGGGYSVVDQTAYQIPAGYGGYADGSTLSYGGADYVVQNNLMFRVNRGGAGRGPNQGSFSYSSNYRGAGQQMRWPNQGGGQQMRWPNQGGGQQMRWPNQGGGQRMQWANQGGGGGGRHIGGGGGHMGGQPSGSGIHLPSGGGIHLGGRL